MVSHGIVTVRLNPSQRPVLDLSTPEGWKAELTCDRLHTEMVHPHTDGRPSFGTTQQRTAWSRTRDLLITSSTA